MEQNKILEEEEEKALTEELSAPSTAGSLLYSEVFQIDSRR